MEKLTTEEIVYFTFFILLSVTKGFGLYDGQKLFTLMIIPTFLCALLKIIISSYTKRQWVMQIVLLCLTFLIYYESGEIGIFFVMFIIMGMKHIALDKVFRIGLWTWMICTICLSIVSFFAIEHTVYRVSDKLGLGYIFRWSLGAPHPNVLHITYLMLCAYIIYALAERYSFRYFILLMIGNAVVFFYSISYTGLGIVTVFLVGELYVKVRPKFGILEKIAVNLVLPVIIFISFALPIMLYDSRFAASLSKLNDLLNTRINVAHSFLVPECMSLFGVKMSYLAQIQPYLSIDSSYVWAFIHYGIIPFALLMLVYFVLIADYTRKQKTRELVMIICFLGAGYTEPLLFNSSLKNVTLLFVGEMLFRQKEGEEEYCLLPGVQKKLEILLQKISKKMTNASIFKRDLCSLFINVWKFYRKQVVAAVAAGMLIGIVFCAMLYKEPSGYVVPRRCTDWRDKTFVCLESADDSAYEGYRIMNYEDTETPMQIMEGNAVRLETVRYYVGSILIGGLIGFFIGTGTVILTDRERL